MKVVITGGSGFIGGHVAEELKKEGVDEVVLYDLYPPKYLDCIGDYKADVNKILTPSVFYRGDVRWGGKLREAFEGADYVFHLAAVSNTMEAFENPCRAVETGCLGTTRVLEAARDCKVKGVLIASSSLVSGVMMLPHEMSPIVIEDMRHVYVATKLFEEMIARSFWEMYGLPFVIFRYGICYGERMTPGVLFDVFIRRGLEGLPLEVHGDGLQYRQYIYVKDLAKAHSRVLGLGIPLKEVAWNRTYHIVPRFGVTVKEVAEAIAGMLNVEIKFVPARKHDLKVDRCEPEVTTKRLFWQMETVQRVGLERTIEWYKKNWRKLQR